MGRLSALFASVACATLCLLQATAQTISEEQFTALNNQDEWDVLNREVGGPLLKTSPFASPCYQNFDSPECNEIRTNYLNDVHRTNVPSAYIQPQWETCQVMEDRCLLDSADPHNAAPTVNHTCGRGSVSEYTINVRHENDIKAAFAFSKRTKIPLVIRNTGHDYKGRSSARGSLGLWTHNLKKIVYTPNFRPEHCPKAKPLPAVTLGAGVQWGEAYAFAEEKNITLAGGADRSVGAVGGWLQGGGHGALSNTMGLGVDRVLQYKIVTPDGEHRIANECQNKDLFFALRGGGGGTFGVVTEATILASPAVKLQALILSFSPANTTRTEEAWSILAQNGLKWAKDGWGGYSNAGAVILVNPVLSREEAAKSIAPMIEYGRKIEAEGQGEVRLIVTEFPSFGAFFTTFSKSFTASVGKNLALASRLISKDNFKTPEKQKELVSALLAANAETRSLIILITAPASVPSTGKTSVTEAWRNSLYHVTTVSSWSWNATKEDIASHYAKASSSIDNLRKITPDAAYLNEADVYEPNFKASFWGEHYERLLRIKNKYDPDRLLDCWHCVGWNPSSSRFSCYLPQQATGR